MFGLLLLMVFLTGQVAAQPAPGYVQITPPPGMRWETQDQSALTKDTVIVDQLGNTWVNTSAIPQLSSSLELVQLVGDSSETNQWMKMRDTGWLQLPADPDWTMYQVFTSITKRRNLVSQVQGLTDENAGSTVAAVPAYVILPASCRLPIQMIRPGRPPIRATLG
jgi:hypothetical protein